MADDKLDEVRRVYLADGTVKEIVVKGAVQRNKEHELLKSGNKLTQAANQRRSEMIDLLRSGYKPSQACKQIGISNQTYYGWRKLLPAFKHQCDLAMQNYYNQVTSEDITTWRTFSAFRKRFFRLDTYYPHAQVIDAIESAQPMEVVLILVAPETGKTTLLEDKICELLAHDPDCRIAYISESSGHSRKVGSRIRKRMISTVDFGDYIARFGPFYEQGQEKEGKPWTNEYFTVNKASHDERDYSFEARGAGSNIQGSRVDKLFLDDVQSIKSLGRTADLIHKFRQEWLTRVGKTGNIFIVGNRIGVGDIYERLVELDLIDRLVEIPILNSDNKSTVPQMWTDEDLIKRRKQVGEDVWQRTYMQDPIAAGNRTFSEEVRESFKDWNRGILKQESMPCVMSLDPGLTNWNCITVAQFSHTKLEVIDQVSDFGLGRTEGILDRVAEMASKYRPQDFIIEMMAFQQALGKDDRMQHMATKYGFRIYPHTTHDNKFDSNYGVGSMATSMRAMELTIPWGDDDAQEKFQPLIDEMITWKPHVRGTKLKQDRIMSLWFIHLYWMNFRNVVDFEAKRAAVKARALPWRPTGLRRLGR